MDELRVQYETELAIARSAYQGIITSRSLQKHSALSSCLQSALASVTTKLASRYTFRDQFSFFYGETIGSAQQPSVERNILQTAAEQLASLADCTTLESLLTFCTGCYNIQWGDLPYYAREFDPYSSRKKPGLTNDEVECRLFAQRLIHCFVESHLLAGRIEDFHCKLIQHRRDLSPAMLLQSALRLQFGFGIVPESRLFSAIFGDRLESSLNGDKATKLGEVSLDQQLRAFLTENGLPFTTDGLLQLLDSYFDHYSSQHSDWFKQTYALCCSKYFGRTVSGDCLTAGHFNYTGWGKGKSSETHSWNAEVPYPDTSYENVRYFLAKQIQLNKGLRNFTREYLDLPLVGEGQWIGELTLLRLVRQLSKSPVIHQWMPDWLGAQRLDIGIPDASLAFEFNGLQHYGPVAFFGGDEGFQKLKRRDSKKRRLCQLHGVKVVDVRFDLPQEAIRAIVERELTASCSFAGLSGTP